MMRRFVAHQGEHQCSTEAGVEPVWPSPRIGLGLAAVVATAPAGAADKVTFTVGTTQDIDSLNPLTGALVIDYEVWNLEYATLTDKAAKDFSVIPGLAESWTVSPDGLTVTYTLRDGLKWSDGQPITADDIAYTINRSRDEEWVNHVSTTANLDAKAIDDRTVEITSSVPDPKLPVMDVYIVPKHIWEKLDATQAPEYEALDGVASGPFKVAEVKKGEFVRMERNPNWHGKQPAMDEVIFRIFSNAEAQYQALKTGRDRRRGRGPGRDLHHPRPERGRSRPSRATRATSPSSG